MYMRPPSPREEPYNLTNLTPDYEPSDRLGKDTEDLLMRDKVRIEK